MTLVQSKPPKGLLRLLLRLPIYLYQARLGWLLGSRFLLLTHRGRRSGHQRQTIIEIVLHDRATGTYFIVSGWGEKSDWFRNVQKTPDVNVQVGRTEFTATAERLPFDKSRQVLFTYGQQHPTAFRTLTKMLIGRRLDNTEETCGDLARAVPVVALRPKHGTAP
jgi:deazaflavin-dependent oxidoreductase (nitroreductase family)